MSDSRLIVLLGIGMIVGDVLYTGAKYVLLGTLPTGFPDAAFWQLTTLLIVWVCRKESVR